MDHKYEKKNFSSSRTVIDWLRVNISFEENDSL